MFSQRLLMAFLLFFSSAMDIGDFMKLDLRAGRKRAESAASGMCQTAHKVVRLKIHSPSSNRNNSYRGRSYSFPSSPGMDGQQPPPDKRNRLDVHLSRKELTPSTSSSRIQTTTASAQKDLHAVTLKVHYDVNQDFIAQCKVETKRGSSSSESSFTKSKLYDNNDST